MIKLPRKRKKQFIKENGLKQYHIDTIILEVINEGEITQPPRCRRYYKLDFSNFYNIRKYKPFGYRVLKRY